MSFHLCLKSMRRMSLSPSPGARGSISCSGYSSIVFTRVLLLVQVGIQQRSEGAVDHRRHAAKKSVMRSRDTVRRGRPFFPRQIVAIIGEPLFHRPPGLLETTQSVIFLRGPAEVQRRAP